MTMRHECEKQSLRAVLRNDVSSDETASTRGYASLFLARQQIRRSGSPPSTIDCTGNPTGSFKLFQTTVPEHKQATSDVNTQVAMCVSAAHAAGLHLRIMFASSSACALLSGQHRQCTHRRSCLAVPRFPRPFRPASDRIPPTFVEQPV